MSAHPESAFKRIPARTERRDRTTIVASISPAQIETYACPLGLQKADRRGAARGTQQTGVVGRPGPPGQQLAA